MTFRQKIAITLLKKHVNLVSVIPIEDKPDLRSVTFKIDAKWFNRIKRISGCEPLVLMNRWLASMDIPELELCSGKTERIVRSGRCGQT